MPSTATITAFYDFVPLTKIRSAQVDNNFNVFRGHSIPVNTDSASSSHLTHDLGSIDHAWRGAYSQYGVMYQNTAGSIPAAPGAGFMNLYFKSDGQLYKKTPAGLESAVGSGGGGGGLNWVEDTDAPIADVEFNNRVYLYETGLSQTLYALIRVPNSYAPGGPVNLRMLFYSPDVTGTALIRAQSTLIRPSADAIDSTANQRTTTNTEVNLATAAITNLPYALVLDLSDSSGLVNGTTITAGSLLKVKLYRDATSTGASDIRVPVYGADITFV